MQTIPIDDVLLVEEKTVSADGRVYVGKEHGGKDVKLVVLDSEKPVAES